MEIYINDLFPTKHLTPGVRFLALVNVIISLPYALLGFYYLLLVVTIFGIGLHYYTWRMFLNKSSLKEALKASIVGLFLLLFMEGYMLEDLFFSNNRYRIDGVMIYHFVSITIMIFNALFMIRMLVEKRKETRMQEVSLKS